LQKNECRKLLSRALDLLINQQKASESISLLKEAVCYYPDERAYYFLTKAYIKTNNALLADSANKICYELKYEPSYELMFNEALIAAVKKDTLLCIDNLYFATEQGFLNKKRIEEETHFDFIREIPGYISLMSRVFGDDEKLRRLLFSSFLKSIPDIAVPYELPIDLVSQRGANNYISYDYVMFIPEMEEGQFSRDVTNEYLYVGKINLENKFAAVIYKTYFAIADTLNPTKTYVLTYDSLGKIIDNEMIGCFCSPSNSQTFKVMTDNMIEVTNYNYKWENDPVEKGYAGNKIVSFDIDKPRQIQISPDGIIKREGVASQLTETPKPNE